MRLLFISFVFNAGKWCRPVPAMVLLLMMVNAYAQQPPDDLLPYARRCIPDSGLAPFYHGVASGDLVCDRVLIWTRLTTADTGVVGIKWRLAEDVQMQHIIRSGFVNTSPENDHTVQVDVQDLESGKWYYYDFEYKGQRSITGRTCTAPGSEADSMRFAMVSCSNFQSGYFTAYGLIAMRDDLDAVIHLGDYIYEYPTGTYGHNAIEGREQVPEGELLSLSDYRIRHAGHRLDPDLRRLHQLYPFICIWDDHEFANDSWPGGAQNHQKSEGDWLTRKEAARQAYFEWLPVRLTDDAKKEQLYRSVQYGELAEFLILDTRMHGRTPQKQVWSPGFYDVNNTMLGKQQYDWLTGRMSSTEAIWKVLIQQVMMAPLEMFGFPVNTDQWDGYARERERLYGYLKQSNIDNFVVLTGDIHSAIATDLPMIGYAPWNRDASAGVEFTCTSVTSPGSPMPRAELLVRTNNAHIRYAEMVHKGYTLIDINKQRIQADYLFTSTIDEPIYRAYRGASLMVKNGETHLRRASELSGRSPEDFPDRPGAFKPNRTPISIEVLGWHLQAHRPGFGISYFCDNPYVLKMILEDGQGKTVLEQTWNARSGTHYKEFNDCQLSSGTYMLTLMHEDAVCRRQIILRH